MIHLIKNAKGKFEAVSLAKNSEYLVGSKQGYDKIAGVIKCIRAQMKECFQIPTDGTILFQNDTTIEPGIWKLGYKTKVFMPDIKPKKKYTPSK